jgi:hypothetical protein
MPHLSSRRFNILLFLFGLIGSSSAQAQQLIGTYTVNYQFNAGGCYGGGDPYFCSYIAPGPIHINAVPGRYRVQVVYVNNAASGGGGLAVWDGDATGGIQYSTGGATLDFDHKFGQITLYYNDWYPYDNDPTAYTVANLIQLSILGGPLTITTTSLPPGTVGSAYTQASSAPVSLMATGGTPPYTWSIVSGSGALPDSLTLASSGAITGTPTTGGTFNFSVQVSDSVGSAATQALSIKIGCQVNQNEINLFPGGPYSLDLKPTAMVATFTPLDANQLPIGLDAEKRACGVTRFNFQQTIDVWPSPSTLLPADPILAGWPLNLPMTAPRPRGTFLDPPAGGYTYNVAGTANRNPYYWHDDPTDQLLRSFVVNVCKVTLVNCANYTVETDSTMLFVDGPADPCLPGGSGKNCTGFAPSFSDLRFTTALVGIDANNNVVDLFAWNWISNFNGTSGGIVATSNYLPVDPGSGTGGVTITSINGIPQTPPSVSCTATPATLWPPNGKSVLVTVSGNIIPGTQAISSDGTTYTVVDEYGEIEPSGSIVPDAGGNYSSGVSLLAARNGNDKDGRTYVIIVSAKDKIGNTATCPSVVTVPHDQGH